MLNMESIFTLRYEGEHVLYRTVGMGGRIIHHRIDFYGDSLVIKFYIIAVAPHDA